MIPDASLKKIRARLAGKRYVVLDTETTGLIAPEVVAAAVVDHRGETRLNALVRPGKPIEPGATAITGITEAKLAGCPAFPEVYPALVEAVAGRTVAIYNAEYDRQALANSCQRYGLPVPRFEAWCVMVWFAEAYGQWDPVRRSFTWQKLATAAAHLGVEPEAAHSAIGDCLTTWRLIQVALDLAGGPDEPTMDSLF